MDWTQIKSYMSNFDTSLVGITRMQIKPIKRTRIDSVPEIYDAKPKFRLCSSCEKKVHTADACWKEHPELMPNYVQNHTRKRPLDADDKSSLSGSIYLKIYM